MSDVITQRGFASFQRGRLVRLAIMGTGGGGRGLPYLRQVLLEERDGHCRKRPRYFSSDFSLNCRLDSLSAGSHIQLVLSQEPDGPGRC